MLKLAINCSVIDIARNGRGSNILVEIIKSFAVLMSIVALSGVFADTAIYTILNRAENQLIATLIRLFCEMSSIILGIMYCVFFEKRKLDGIGICRVNITSICVAGGLGLAMFTLVILVGLGFDGFIFTRINRNVNVLVLVAFLGGYIIQGLAEEILFRSYVFLSMSRKNSVIAAAIMSSAMFSLIHIFNEGITCLALMNLFMFGILEVLLLIYSDNIWIPGMVHGVWNYAQGCVFGLPVSGKAIASSLSFFEQTDKTYINGGVFGPEGGFAVTFVLLLNIVALYGLSLKKHKISLQ